MPTIASLTVPNCDIPGTTASLFLYAKRSFIAANGIHHIKGKYPQENWRYKFDCTIENRELQIGAKDVDPTTNSDDESAEYEAVLIDQFDERQNFSLKSFRLPHDLGDTVTWEQIKIFNSSQPIILPDEYYTVSQTNQLFATLAQNPQFIEALATNPTLLSGIAESQDFIDLLIESGNFLETLIENQDFLNNLIIALMNNPIVSKAQNFNLTNPTSGNLRAAWQPSNSVFPFDHYILRLRIAED